jgi:hypothetical protein
MMKKTIYMIYKYMVEYEHADHLKDICDDLKDVPLNAMSGAGVASDGNVYSYSCDRVGKGKVKKQ